jgi:uncharacterized protein YceK
MRFAKHIFVCLVFLIVPLVFTCGCMSSYCHARGPEAVGKPSYIYPGTEMDLRESPVGLIDLPFSFCLDTFALPFDLYAVTIRGRPRYDCQWPYDHLTTMPTNAISK